MEGYWMESYSISTTPNIGGIRTDTPHMNAAGKVWSVDIRYDGINIPYCVRIQINASAALNKWNVLKIKNVDWSYDAPGGDRGDSPDHGFYFPRPGEILYPGEMHNTSYTFVNDDPDVPLSLNYLEFYLDTVWYEPEEQWDSIGTLIEEVTGPFVLYPGQSLSVPLNNIPDRRNSYIYVAGEMEYQMPDFDSETVQFRDGHEEEVPPYMIPSLLQLTGNSSVYEGVGSVPITATRTGGDYGEVTVDYFTSDGTATPGIDYFFTAGTLIWPDGDMTPKTFIIPILDDTLIEGDETVNLTLNNPTGGATLGTPNTAVLTIIDDDQPTPPTLSQWVLIVLALSVGGFFVWQLRKRRKAVVSG
jgi:hypothetical protein